MSALTRRKFLYGSSVTTALVATGGLGTNRKLLAQAAPNQAVYNASVAAHSVAVGNAFTSGSTVTDWVAVQNTNNNVINEWSGAGRDNYVRVAAAQVSRANSQAPQSTHRPS